MSAFVTEFSFQIVEFRCLSRATTSLFVFVVPVGPLLYKSTSSISKFRSQSPLLQTTQDCAKPHPQAI